MSNYYSADYILTAAGEPLPKGVIGINRGGVINGVFEHDDPEIANKSVLRLKGVLVPGFVNAHCHLELSHMAGLIPKYEGLVSFIKQVVQHRKQGIESQMEAMHEADERMRNNGIVAVGDISNTALSKEIKFSSLLYYHTFAEVLGFDPARADMVFEAGVGLYEQFKPLPVSLAPHAPYSVSQRLHALIGSFAGNKGRPVTIHHQETEDENRFFMNKSGGFVSFYQSIKADIDFFEAPGTPSTPTFLPFYDGDVNLLLVHNSYSTASDIEYLKGAGKRINICFCPNANLYIENRLPDVNLFLDQGFNLTLGTDSLASNDELSILSEMKTLCSAFPFLQLPEVLKWATLNGARFLGIEQRYGSLETGKSPGLNLLTNMEGLALTSNTEVKRIV